jgi:tubulin polyglutamylase TTLL6/13
VDNIPPHEHIVAQRYISDPYLIDGLKFDLRIYVLLNGINPLRAYVYNEGLARFATAEYEAPNPKNLNNMFMHLTNYAINKNADNFMQNENEDGKGRSHKRSLNEVYKLLESKGHDIDSLKEKIDDLIVKTLITGQPSMWYVYRSSQPEDVENQLCFQILGFDVMLDKDLKPWLIEVNHAPSLATESAFDLKVKKELVQDTLRILNLSAKRKSVYINNQKSQF